MPLMALVTSNSHALDWLLEPDISVTERYTDNLRMQTHPTRDNLITTVSPGILLGYLADNNELKTTFKWNELIYHDESELDFSEKIANLNHQFSGELFKTEFAAQYAEQSSINTQLDVDGSGDIQIQVPRTTHSVSPSITFNLTELDALQLGYSYVDVAFDRAPNQRTSLSYSDYDNQQFSATFTHMFSEKLSANLMGAYSMFNTASNSSELTSDIFGFPIDRTTTTDYEQQSSTLLYQAGLQYAFDKQTQLSVSAGMRDTENQTRYRQAVTYDPEILPFINTLPQVFEQSGGAVGHVFSVNLKHDREWGGFTLNAGQQLNPSSTGSQQQSTTFSTTGHYNIDERWTTGLSASYLLSESVSNFAGNNGVKYNRTYSSISPNLRWRWTPQLSLELSYSYRQQDIENGSSNPSSMSNNVLLQISFQPKINRQVK